MQRKLIGLIALALLILAGVLYARGSNVMVMSGCLRMAIVLWAVWLAYDQVHQIATRTPPWIAGAVGVCLLVIVVRPKAVLALAPLLLGVLALHFFGRLLKP